MDKLDALRKSVSDMSDEELQAYVRDLKVRRTNPAPSRTQKRADVAEKKKASKDMKAIFANMTPEMKAKLLASLEGK